MGLFDFLKSPEKEIKAESKGFDPNAFSTYRPLFNLSYDGEKNSGELGAPVRYHIDYRSLRIRSWQSYLENEITQTVIKKYVGWIIGSGLKLQSEPMESVLQSEGFTIDANTFSKQVEDRFKLFSESKSVDYKGIKNLNQIASEVYLNTIVGGDVLVIVRIINASLTLEMIDGAHVQTPLFDQKIPKNHKLENGIETNRRGEVVAYWVKQSDMKFRRVKARGANTGRVSAFMVYGLGYRINDNRGIPFISTVLETLQKLDRYKEATVGSAEERAKVPYFIEHGQASTGENPLQGNMAKAFNIDAKQDIPVDINGEQLADTVAVSMNKQVFNMPVDSKIVSMETKNDIHFNEFYSPNVNAICSAIGIPPEVALSKYDSNFSASRAALKDWEHTLNVERKKFSDQFYKIVFSLWLELEVLKNKVSADGFLTLMTSGNEIGLAAYMNCRFVGANVPHIDPVKEVQAERMKLGESGANIPLTTAEAATEALNGGDFDTNLSQYIQELDKTNINTET